MADLQIDILDSSSGANFTRQLGIVYTSATVGYVFGKDADNRFVQLRTNDAGANWNSPVQLISSTNADRFVLWFDQWTSGDSGTLIHILYSNTTDGEMSYFSFDTSDDSETAKVTVAAIAPGGDPQLALSITKTRGGNLYAGGTAELSGPPTHFFARSTDAGANWTSRAAFSTEPTASTLQLLPGNETDNQDVWAALSDRITQNSTFSVYDDSADSWSHTDLADTNDSFLIVGAILHSNGHAMVLAFRNDRREVLCWDINGAGSITSRTSVVTTSDNSHDLNVCVDQNSDRFFVVYGSADANENVFYKISTDFGVTWGSEVQFNDDAISAKSIASVAQSSSNAGGVFQPVWTDTGGQAPNDIGLITNAGNAVLLIATDAGTATVTSSPSHVAADGNTTSTITVTLLTAQSDPVEGHTVTLAQGGGSSTIVVNASETNSSGVIQFSVSNSTVETVTYTATDTTDSVTITQTANVVFFDPDDGTSGDSPPGLIIPAGEGGIGPSPPVISIAGTTSTTTNIIGSEESSINFAFGGGSEGQKELEFIDEFNEVVISSG